MPNSSTSFMNIYRFPLIRFPSHLIMSPQKSLSWK
jgi:hypothetical protein